MGCYPVLNRIITNMKLILLAIAKLVFRFRAFRPFAKIFFRYSLWVRQTDWTVSGCESSCLIEASSLSANSSDRLVI